MTPDTPITPDTPAPAPRTPEKRSEAASKAAAARWAAASPTERRVALRRARAAIKPANRRNRWAGIPLAERAAAMERVRAARRANAKPRPQGEGQLPRSTRNPAPPPAVKNGDRKVKS